MSNVMLKNARDPHNNHKINAYDFDEFDVAQKLVRNIRKNYAKSKSKQLRSIPESDVIELSLAFNSKVFANRDWDNYSI